MDTHTHTHTNVTNLVLIRNEDQDFSAFNKPSLHLNSLTFVHLEGNNKHLPTT